MKMGFIMEEAGGNIRLIITKKEGFTATSDQDGNILLEGPEDAWSGLGELIYENI